MSQQSMAQKVCLVTGATLGIGKVTALALARQGATVVMVGRDPQRTAKVLDELRAQVAEFGSGSGSGLSGGVGVGWVEALVADFGSQAQIRRLADQFRARYNRLDVLVNNAGGIFPQGRTADGIETTFAVNHLGYFLLTNLLQDLLVQSAPARIVNVSSAAHRQGRIHFDDLNLDRGYTPMKAYTQSKLANLLFTYELARRLHGTGVTVNAVHPGVVGTGFGAQLGLIGWFYRVFGRLMLTPEQGADTLIYLATAPEVAGVTGRYFVKRRERRSSNRSYDEAAARGLWEVSAALTGLG